MPVTEYDIGHTVKGLGKCFAHAHTVLNYCLLEHAKRLFQTELACVVLFLKPGVILTKADCKSESKKNCL